MLNSILTHKTEALSISSFLPVSLWSCSVHSFTVQALPLLNPTQINLYYHRLPLIQEELLSSNMFNGDAHLTSGLRRARRMVYRKAPVPPAPIKMNRGINYGKKIF